MIYKALALGAVIGFVVALAPSCGGAKCSPANCQGCCDAQNKCVSPANTNQACGAAGNVCAACTGTDTCQNGVCLPPGGGDGGCNGCIVNNVCVTGTQDTNCGRAGGACTNCLLSSQRCVNQACGTSSADAGAVGEACTTDTDCARGNVPGLVCRRQTTTGAGTYSGGYCTRLCPNANECGTESTCVSFGAVYDEPADLCMKRCTPPNSNTSPDCRPGYRCYGLSGGGAQGICWITPPPQIDAGIADKVGNTCTTNAQCMNPPIDGICITDAEDAGFVGGYCSAPCSSNPKCGDGGTCVNVGSSTNPLPLCFTACAAPLGGQSGCRSGYVCGPLFLNDGGTAPQGFCWPHCSNSGSECPSNFACQPSGPRAGYCCNDGGTCI